jgi:hypothetical protein
MKAHSNILILIGVGVVATTRRRRLVDIHEGGRGGRARLVESHRCTFRGLGPIEFHRRAFFRSRCLAIVLAARRAMRGG